MRLIFLILFIVLHQYLQAQDGQYNLGARNAGLGFASSTITDAWSVFNNIGGLGRLDQSSAFFSYQNRYQINELQSLGGGAVITNDFLNAGLGIYRFGGDLFNEQKIKLAIGHQLDMISLGIGLNLIQFTIEGLETQRKVAIEFGGNVQLSEQLVLAAHIYNFQQSDLIPTVMKAGLSYRPTSTLMINIETEKDLAFKEIFRAGIEYQIIPPLYLRTGLQTAPIRPSYGIGYVLSTFNFDYAFSDNSELNPTHEVSITYRINKK